MRASLTVAIGVTWCLCWPQPGQAVKRVRMVNRSQCFETERITSRLEAVLSASTASWTRDLVVSVTTTDAAQGQSVVSLTVQTSWGGGLLERKYDLNPADCRSAGDLLALVLERFLATFPEEKWVALARKAAALPSAARPRTVQVAARVATSALFFPLGVAAELGVVGEVGSTRHRFGLSMTARVQLPEQLGQGHFVVVSPLVGLLWRYTAYAWQPSLEVRAGPALIRGYGFDVSTEGWVPWVDVLGTIERRWRRVGLGVHVAFTVLRHRALTEDAKDSRELPIVGVGAHVTVPFFDRTL